MTPKTETPLLLIARANWTRSGNSIGFHCPECDSMIWTYIDQINEHGTTHLKRVCPKHECDWTGKVRLEGWGAERG